jgi:hypothetical protein
MLSPRVHLIGFGSIIYLLHLELTPDWIPSKWANLDTDSTDGKPNFWNLCKFTDNLVHTAG